MKTKAVFVGLAVFAAGMFYFAVEVGSKRNVHDVVWIDRFVPVPIILDVYSGSAQRLEDGKIKATFSPARPRNPSAPYFNCIGSFRLREVPVYLLEIDGVIYLEKAEFVEPLIQGVTELSLGLPKGALNEASMVEILEQMPTDRALLDQTSRRFKAPEGVDGQPRRKGL